MYNLQVNKICLVLLILTLAVQTNSRCSGFNSIDLIQTGTVSFSNLNQGQYCQQVAINYTIPTSGFQAISSLQSFNGNNNFLNGLDYSINSNPKQSSNSFVITLILNTQCNWTSISVSYLASSRNDLILGRFVTDVEQSLGCSNQNNNANQYTANLKQIVPNWNTNWNVNKVIAFISGLKIKQSVNSFITIGLAQINQTLGSISINLNLSQDVEIQLIKISYIIVLQNFPFKNEIQSIDATTDYSISALQSFRNNNFGNINWAISANRLLCSFSKCPTLCVNSSTCSSLSGYAFQQQCLNCQNNQIWNGTACVSSCPVNRIWNGVSCQCKSGFYASSSSNCDIIPTCPKGSTFNLQSLTCSCTQADTYLINNVCSKCPAFSQWNGFQCSCQSGYSFSGVNCVSVCSSNQIWSNGKCVSQNGISCPINSAWNGRKLICQCINPNLYLINSSCQSCGLYQSWNGQACVCNSPYIMIQNQCTICDKFSIFNGTECVCNQGYFGTRNNCSPCFSNCGTCSGPNFNNCLTCADVTFVFRNNSCSRPNQCPQGLFLSSNSSCTPCATYCSNCTSNTDCSQCITGFNLQSLAYGGVMVRFCVQICGDGRRFQLECDDGNTKNGDGCNSNCKVQSGWSCSGGSSIQASSCTQSIPNKSTISLTGKALLLGKVVQGVRISYLPPQLTANDCPQCHQLLWVRVIRSDIIPAVSVQYMPKSQFQFLVQFDFSGTFSIPVFMVSVQINPQFARFFNGDDLAQIQICSIDPSLLAMNDQSGALGFSDISNNNSTSLNISSSLVQQIFK